MCSFLDAGSPKSGIDRPLVALWGFAEATLFFVVPDVPISYVALGNRRRGLEVCLWAVTGALAGGALMYAWGARDPAGARVTLALVPTVSAPMIDGVRAMIDERGLLGMFLGAFAGKPYKIFAAESGAAALPFLPFLLLSIPARIARFLLTAWIVGTLSTRFAGRMSTARRRQVLTAFWFALYAIYVAIVGL